MYLFVKKESSNKVFSIFERNIGQYVKYNKILSNNAFKDLAAIDARKKEIKAEIDKKFENEDKRIKKEMKDKIKKEMEKNDENPQALEDWYRDFTNSSRVAGSAE